MNKSIVLEKSIKFALRIVGVYKYLTDNKKEYVMFRNSCYFPAVTSRNTLRPLYILNRSQGFHLKCIRHWRKDWKPNYGFYCLKRVIF